jgi:hypothetical protein
MYNYDKENRSKLSKTTNLIRAILLLFNYTSLTVQVIALLAAFQKKTGCALDGKELKERRRKIQSENESFNRLNALTSFMWSGNKQPSSSVSNKNQLTPTLIIVPPRFVRKMPY